MSGLAAKDCTTPKKGEAPHPNLEVGYKRCLVQFSTRAASGLAANTFIGAAKADDLL